MTYFVLKELLNLDQPTSHYSEVLGLLTSILLINHNYFLICIANSVYISSALFGIIFNFAVMDFSEKKAYRMKK